MISFLAFEEICNEIKLQYEQYMEKLSLLGGKSVEKCNSPMGTMTMTMDGGIGIQSLGYLNTKMAASPLATVACHNLIRNSAIMQSNVPHWSQVSARI